MNTRAYAGFLQTLERARTLLALHEDMTKEGGKGRPPVWASDILRAIHVFVMASLDSYVHNVIHEMAYPVIVKSKGKSLPRELVKALQDAIPYEKTFEVWQAKRPSVHISNALRKRNSEWTFMKPAKIEVALKMIGIGNIWEFAAKSFHRRRDGLRRTFEHYAERRDKIAHEGDVGKATRYKGKLRSIRRPYVVKALADVQRLVQTVDKVVSDQRRV